jgi:hypothetical protein
VLSKDKVQGLGVLCKCCVGAVAVLNNTSQGFGCGAWFSVRCQARIRCGFGVKKSISVRTRIQVGRAGCVQFMVLCCAGARMRAYLKARFRCLVPIGAVVLNG